MGWDRSRVLSKGSYGVVFFVKSLKSKKSLAVKSSPLESGHSLFNLVLGYAPGATLSNLIKFYGGNIPELHVHLYVRMLLQGLSCIHSKGYVHCDLKPSNILVFRSQEWPCLLKIADFGVAKEPTEKVYPKRGSYNFRGTPSYMSPEAILFNIIEASVDIWALGCIVLEMITGKPPWNTPDIWRRFDSVAESPRIPVDLSEEAKDFLVKCFAINSAERWTADILLDHPFARMDEKPTSVSLGTLVHPAVSPACQSSSHVPAATE